jgi:RND family efflux transporter MFP subunit
MLLGLLAGVPLAGCSSEQVQASVPAAALPVGIRLIEAVEVDEGATFLAVLRSRTSAAVSPEVDGQITHIYVTPGQRVAAGAPVVQIDADKQQAAVANVEKQLAAQRASVRFAAQQLERTTFLSRAGVASQQELEQAQTAHEVAAASLESLTAQVNEQRQQLRYYTVAAPTSGIVGDIPARVGDRVTSATVITTLDQPQGLEAYVQVPIERAPLLRHGLPVQLVDGGGKVVCETHVGFISPEVDTNTQTVLVKAPVHCPGQTRRTSEYVRARLIWGRASRPLVPVLAVSRVNGQPFVFVAQPQREQVLARQVAVRLGDTVDNEYVVLEGVKPGDQLIVTGTQILADGMPVQPMR